MKRTIAVTVMCVTMMLMGAYVWADAPQSRCTRIGQKWVDFWNDHDITKAFDVFTEDIVYEDIPFDMVYVGDKFLGFAQGFFEAFPKPNSSFKLGQSACQGQKGFFEWIWNAVDGGGGATGFCGTGKPVTVRGVTVIEIQGNRISHDSDFLDFATVLRQLLPEGRECVAGLIGLGE